MYLCLQEGADDQAALEVPETGDVAAEPNNSTIDETDNVDAISTPFNAGDVPTMAETPGLLDVEGNLKPSTHGSVAILPPVQSLPKVTFYPVSTLI